MNGEEGTLDVMGWYDRNSDSGHHPVAMKEPNAWGIFDMHGNVMEWCNNYAGNSRYVCRGGSWYSDARSCTVGKRFVYDSDGNNQIGFRLAASDETDVKEMAEKDVVSKQCDTNVVDGLVLSHHVNVELGSWIDPSHPTNKYFRVRVVSNTNNPLPIVSKDIVFILDATGSIGNDRLGLCSKAVSDALGRLKTGDRFIVGAFRDKLRYAFSATAWREVDKSSIDEARKWLSMLTAHGKGDLFNMLDNVLVLPRAPARPITALVMTDDDAAGISITRAAEIITRFSEQNAGLVSIFVYGVKPTENTYLMSMLTRCNRGGWACHEGPRWQTDQRHLSALMKKFEKPMLSDVTVNFSASSRAETYPKFVPNLGEDVPIEIYGVCPVGQKDISFQIRGHNGVASYKSSYLLPFASAQPLDCETRVVWATYRLYGMYAEYARTQSEKLLAEIHAFAATHGIEAPLREKQN